MSIFGRSEPDVTHVYHHYEGKPCEKCGYRENTGYFNIDSMYNHILHTINDSDILLDRLKNGVEEKKSNDKEIK